MSWVQGVNFRGSSGYVTDGADTGYEIGTTANYTGARTLAAGNAVGIGWEDAPTLMLDRGAVDPRVAGAGFVSSLTRYRIDLPATGTYSIAVAAADAAGGGWDSYIEIFDTTTSLGVVCNKAPVTPNYYVNVNDTEYFVTSPGNIDDTQDFVFSSTILRFKVNQLGAGFGMISHILITQLAAAGGTQGKPLVNSGLVDHGLISAAGLIGKMRRSIAGLMVPERMAA